jgi:plastocyanin
MNMKWTYVFSLAAAVAFAASCANPPFGGTQRSELAKSTRTGKIHDIKIGETISPKEIQVSQGDEIRWINMRNGVVKVVFIDTLKDRVSCQNNFGGTASMFSSNTNTKEYETKIGPNDHASLCLSSPGTYTYTARMEDTTPGGEKVDTAAVRVQ